MTGIPAKTGPRSERIQIPVPGHYFFFSYARSDEENQPHIDKFFEDLETEIRSQEGTIAPNVNVGFRDKRNIEVGHQWPSELTEALRYSKAIVCLYSPTYFNRPFCGKEVQAFLSRHRAHPKAGSTAAILPVIWRKPERVPGSVTRIQYDSLDLPKSYRDHGLRRIMTQRRHSDDYKIFVETFADKIRAATRVNLQADPNLDIGLLANAFEETLVGGEEPAARPGPGTVRFVYVSGTRSEIQRSRIREILDAYGSNRHEWNPYFSTSDQDSIWKIANQIASDKNLFPEKLEMGESFSAELKKAKEENSLVVLLIDTWTLKLDEIVQKMEEYDERTLLNCAALVIWDQSDETRVHADALETLLARVFDDNFARNHPRFFKPNVLTRDTLINELGDTLQALKLNVINRGQPKRFISARNEPIPSF